MTLPDGTYEEWLAFERSGSVGRWHHVTWSNKAEADRNASKIMLADPSICCLHHSPTEPTTDRPESAFGQKLEAAR